MEADWEENEKAREKKHVLHSNPIESQTYV